MKKPLTTSLISSEVMFFMSAMTHIATFVRHDLTVSVQSDISSHVLHAANLKQTGISGIVNMYCIV